MILELYTSSGCSRCRQAADLLRELMEETRPVRFELRVLDVISHLDRAVSAGVTVTPALVSGGRVLCAPLPERKRLREILLEALEESV